MRAITSVIFLPITISTVYNLYLHNLSVIFQTPYRPLRTFRLWTIIWYKGLSANFYAKNNLYEGDGGKGDGGSKPHLALPPHHPSRRVCNFCLYKVGLKWNLLQNVFKEWVLEYILYGEESFNPITDGGWLIAPAVWKTSSSSASFDFWDPKT